MQSAVADLLFATRQCVFLDRMLYGLYIVYALESKQQPPNSFSPHLAARISVHLIVFVFNLYLQIECFETSLTLVNAGETHQSD